ncbi:MAG: BTAD domain-containing putative transcriptional regulator, partial [Chloroflexota bacterium]
MSLKINLFGAPYIEKDGESISVDTRKAIAILAYIIVTNTRQSRETLATLLWEDSDTKSAKASLRRTLSTLNKALNAPDLIIERRAVTFVVDDSTSVDVVEFESLLKQVENHSHDLEGLCEHCLTKLEKACALYTGYFMLGFGLRDSIAFDDWQTTQGEYYQRRLMWALSQILDALVRRREYARAIEYANIWLEIDPLHEATHRMLMRLFAWQDDRSSALQQYRACVRILDQELGVTPLEETTTLYHELQNSTLAHRPQKPKQVMPLQSVTKAVTRSVFVGRELELQKLSDIYMKSRHQQQICVIEGEQGIGKTRLLEELVNSLQADTTYGVVRSFANESG